MKSTRILVTGANGQLGSKIRAISDNYPEFDFFFTTRQELDICDQKEVEEYVSLNNIKSIINCAACTAVDKAESEPELADKINHLAVNGLAEIARKYEIKLIHISTDYVFDGNSIEPYKESDVPNPQTIYGKTKLTGELAMQKVNPENSIIIRISWVFSRFGNNFVKTKLRLGNIRDEINVVADQVGSSTNAANLAQVILEILPQLENPVVELFHHSNEGECSWYEFAKVMLILKNYTAKINPIPTSNYPTPAFRPLFSGLNKSRIFNEFNIYPLDWSESLVEFLNSKDRWDINWI